jgi:hypothetical protein
MHRTQLRIFVALIALIVGFAGCKSSPSKNQPHTFGAAPGGRTEWFDNMRAIGHFYPTDPVYGAQGDCVTDDAAAIMAADADALAKGGAVYFAVPSGGCYRTNSELAPQSQGWYGDGSLGPWLGNDGGATGTPSYVIRAGAPMRSVILVSPIRGTVEGAREFNLRNLAFDGNALTGCPNCAQYAILRGGDFLSNYLDVWAINASVDCVHATGHLLPFLLSAVTPGGGNTSPLISVRMRDPLFGGFVATTPFVVKVTTAGTLGVNAAGSARYTSSVNNGVTFFVTDQGIYAQSNLFIMSGFNFNNDSGVRITFPPGAYALNDTWSFTATLQPEQGSNNGSTNTDTLLTNVWSKNCGTAFTSAAQASNYSNLAILPTTLPGTASVPFGQVGLGTLVTGTGTNWLTGIDALGVRPGDIMFVAGGAGNIAMVGALDDFHVAPQNGTFIPATSTTQTWAITRGASFWEQEQTDLVRNEYVHCRTENSPQGFRCVGDSSGGPRIYWPRIEQYAAAGLSCCGWGSAASGTVLESLEIKAAGVNSVPFFFLPSFAGGNVIEPLQIPEGPPIPINYGAFYNYQLNGQISSIGNPIGFVPSSQVRQLTEWGSPQAFAISTGAEIIPAPSVSISANPAHFDRVNSSFRELCASGPVTMTNATPIAGAAIAGLYMHVVNTCAPTITFTSAGTNLNIPAAENPIALAQFGSLTFYAPGFFTWTLIGKN